MEAFVFQNFNCCPLVWHFTSMTSVYLHESIQKKTTQLLCNDGLLAKANKPSMEIKRYRTQPLETFKTLNVLNSTYMRDLFYLRSSSARQPSNKQL